MDRAVVSSACRYGYVDRDVLEFVIQPQFNAAGDFNDGLALGRDGTEVRFYRYGRKV